VDHQLAVSETDDRDAAPDFDAKQPQRVAQDPNILRDPIHGGF